MIMAVQLALSIGITSWTGRAYTIPLCSKSPLSSRGRSLCATTIEPTADSLDEDDFSDLDKWLSRGRDENEAVVDRPRWSVTAAGPVHGNFFSSEAKTFAELGASERLMSNLKLLGMTQPSTAQAELFKPVLNGDDTLLAYPSGMGKTWGYLAPLVQKLWEWEEAEGRTPKGQVRVIILVPNAELGQQVLDQARKLANRSIRASIATGEGSKWSTQRDRLRSGLELLVVTMGRLVAHLSPRDAEPSFSLAGTRAVVVDEADALYAGEAPSWYTEKHLDDVYDLGDSFDDSTDKFGDSFGANHPLETRRKVLLQEPPLANWKWVRSELPVSCATCLVTSQVPKGIETLMLGDVPHMGKLLGKGLHITRRGVEVSVVDCSIPAADERGRRSVFLAKVQELQEVLAGGRADGVDGAVARKPKRAVVVCNNAATCQRLVRVLVDEYSKVRNAEGAGVPWVHEFHASLRPERRKRALSAFRQPVPGGPARVLVSTGRALRGLELGSRAPGEDSCVPRWPVDHVILFDFPPDARAYLARVGIATRGNRTPAKVTALAVGSQLAFAKAMQVHDEEGSELDVQL